MIDPLKLIHKRKRLSSVLGLALDGSRLEGLVLERGLGGFRARQLFSVSLSLDPLTGAPELVGREIRNHLEAAGLHERHCIVGLPLKWALTTHVEVPDLSEADMPGFLHLEAERGFPCDAETLHVGSSRCQPPGAKPQVLLVGIPRNHLAVLEQVLRAAKLKPVSFSLGITALQPAAGDPAAGVLALAVGETHVALQVTCAGGVVALRMLEGALEMEGAERVLHADVVAREARITLGQLPAELRQAVRRVRIFGPRDLAQQLADEMELRFESMGLEIECVSRYAPNQFGAAIPADTAVSPAFSLAAELLAGQPTAFEFLPPHLTAWQQMAARYSSGKLRTTLTAAGSVAALVAAVFLFQQLQLWNLQAKWRKMAPRHAELKDLQDKVQKYRDWYDETVKGLTILRALSVAFPEDNSVTAKTIEIRDLKTCSCSGTARSLQALLGTQAKMRNTPQFRDVNLGPTRGQPPALQFTITFDWKDVGQSAN